ncbi:MAG: DUF3106 domain-containing protein [Alphaproteobacteria bacterium]
MTVQLNKFIHPFKLKIAVVGFCLVVLLPSLSWALDGADNWRNLSPQERENVLRNYQRWQNLAPQDKEHLQEEWQRWRSLPQDQRDRLRKRYDELHKLSPKEQRQLREQYDRKRSRRDRNND